MNNSCKLVKHSFLIISLKLIDIVHAELLKGAGNVNLFKHFILLSIGLKLLYRLGVQSLHQLLEDGLLIVIFKGEVCNITESVLCRQHSF